jgi:hypothetical protein
MAFRITGLDPEPFRHLFGLSNDELEKHGVQRYGFDKKPGFPDRIEMRDLDIGDTALLLNYVHQPADTPYRASHAIFVREWAEPTYLEADHIPEVMRVRPISLRGFNAKGEMIEADLADGQQLEPVIERFFANSDVDYIQAHYAKRGCYAARIDRSEG